MQKDSPYHNYTQLLEKVDRMFAGVFERHGSKFNCKKGCYSCCRADLSVCHVEASYITDWLAVRPDLRDKIHRREGMLNDASFCSLLDQEGACSIYEARPLICRSHGLPISWKQDVLDGNSSEQRDVCPLNFQGVDINELEQIDVLSIDKANILLSLVNRAFDESAAEARVQLSKILD